MTLLALVIVLLLLLIIASHRAATVQWNGAYINWIDGFVRLLCKYLHRLPVTHIPLPNTGGAIIAANHISGLDPFLLIAASDRPLRFLIAREEYERPILNWLFKAAGCIPVDRSGKPELALRQALRALQQGEVIALFPHGKIHLDTEPPKKLKGGVTRLAAWADVPVYPVRIDGVGKQGSVILAPFVPSQVQLTIAAPLSITEANQAESLHAIASVIELANRR